MMRANNNYDDYKRGLSPVDKNLLFDLSIGKKSELNIKY